MRPSSAAACGLALIACALLAQDAAAQQGLQRFTSRAYVIHTNLPKQEVVEIGRHMDSIFAQYEKRFQGFRSRRTGPMPLYLLDTREDYVAFMGQHGVPAENSGGMFFVMPGISGLATWSGDRSRSETFEVLQHEGFHQFAFNYLGDLPVWANEGLAQYFEDAIIVGGRMEVGFVDDRRLGLVKKALEENRSVPLARLLAMTNETWGRTLQADPMQSGLLYAQSWSLAYFLVHADGQKYQGPFSRYLNLLSEGRDPDTAFEDAFGGANPAAVEKRWRTYIEKLEPDPLTTAIGRLEFLAQGLLFMQKQGETPADFAALRTYLGERGFSLKRSSHGIETTFDGADPELYRYTKKGGAAMDFELLPPEKEGLPPRLTAPGLKPVPTLVWSKDDAGELVSDIRFK